MKVLIVEDEILSRIGLRQLVDWENLGLTLLEDAADGEEAMNTIRKEYPDIILLDLNIPKINGLQLLEQLKEYHYEYRVIVISCNEEFDKVKEAMKLGAYDYLRKLNLSSGELLRTLVKCKSELRNKTVNANKSVLHGIIREIKYENLISENGRQIFMEENSYEILICIQLQAGPEAIYLLEEKFRKLLAEYKSNALIIRKDLQSCFYLFPEDFQISFLKDCSRQLEKTVEGKVYMGCVYHKIKNTQELFESLILSEQIRTISYYDETETFWVFSERIKTNDHSPRGMLDLIHELQSMVAKFDREKIQSCISRVFRLIRDTPYTSVNVLRRIFMDMLGIYSIAAQSMGGAIEEIYIREDNCHYQNVMMMNSLMQIETWFLEFSDEFLRCFLIIYKCSRSEILKKALAYIKENLYLQVQLSDTAKEIGVSAAYLSTLFKKEMGQNFIEYVNQQKTEAAKQLLEEGKMVYEISDKLGYENSTYFSKVFKKFTNMSPDSYRKLHTQKNCNCIKIKTI